ncbi:MAG: lytic transglycosylase domain-containing protein [Syntrophaceae bacterium]
MGRLLTFLVGIFLFTVGFLNPACVLGDIYKYVDGEGVIHITNVKTDTRYKLWIKETPRERMAREFAKGDYDELIKKAALKHNLDQHLIRAVIKTESGFNHKAVSRKGAMGLMQLMPGTASSLNVSDSFDPWSNIDGGSKYLRYLLNTFSGNLPLALAAYNAGERAVTKYNYRIPPYPETQTYVRRVLHHFRKYSDSTL